VKVSSISNVNQDANGKNGLHAYTPVMNKEMPNDSVSFGGVADKLKDGTTEIFKWIEKNGFFVEFLIIDTISMILPRIWVGLNRDKDKIGHLNYKAGAEEAGREITSGPSMNLIPMGLLGLATMIKPASHMERNTLKSLTQNLQGVLDNNPPLTIEELNSALADKLFEDAFDTKKYNLPNRNELKKEFNRLLVSSTQTKKKLFNNEAFKNNTKEFTAHVQKINNLLELIPAEDEVKQISKPLDTGLVKLSNGGVSAKDLYSDFRNYSRDVIDKLSKTVFSGNKAEKSKEFIKNIMDSRLKLKTTSAITAFFAVGTFLLYLPKLYQQGNVSPAEESAKRAQAEALAAKGGAK